MGPPPWVANLEAKDLLSSREIDWMIYAYLNEAGLSHTAYMLLHEAGLLPKAAQVDAVPHDTHATGSSSTAPADSPLQVPPGHLVRMLVKGILFYHSEAYVNGAELDRPLRIIDCVPGTALSKHQIAPVSHDKKDLVDPPTKSFVKRKADQDDSKRKKKDKRDPPSNGSANVQKGEKSEKSKSDDRSSKSDEKPSKSDDSLSRKPSKSPSPPENGSTETPTDATGPSPAAVGAHSPTPPPVNDTPMDVDKSVSHDTGPSHDSNRSDHSRDSPSLSPGPAQPPRAPKSKVVVQTRAVPRKPIQRSPLPPPAGIQEAHGAGHVKLPSSSSVGPKVETPSAQSSAAPSAPSSVSEAPHDSLSTPTNTESINPHVRLTTDSKDVVLLSGHSKRSIQMCAWNPLNPEGFASMSHDATLRIWEVPEISEQPANQLVLESKISPCRHSSLNRKNVAVTSGEWDPSGSLIATGDLEGHARVWTPSGEMPIFMTRHKESLVAVKWNASGTSLLTASEDATICLWNLDNGRVKSQWSTGGTPVTDIDWHTDASFAAATQDGTVLLFSIHEPNALARFKLHSDDVNVIRFSPDGTLIASAGDDGRVFVSPLVDISGLPLPPGSNTERAREIAALPEHHLSLPHSSSPVHSLQWFNNSPGGPPVLVTGSRDGNARVWNVDSGSLIYDLSHEGPVYSVAFHPTQPLLAIGASDGLVRVWRLPGLVSGEQGSSRDLLLEFAQQDEVFDVYWNPHRLQLAVSGPADTIAVVPVKARVD